MAKSARQSSRLNVTAENIGTALGHMAVRLDAWKKQRAVLAAEITALANAAQSMLGALGHPAPAPASDPGKGGRPKGYVTSDETRAKLRAAWERRRAISSGSLHEHTKPANGRATIRASEGKKFTARQRGRG